MEKIEWDEDGFVFLKDDYGRRLDRIRLCEKGFVLRKKLPRSRGDSCDREFDILLYDYIAAMVSALYKVLLSVERREIKTAFPDPASQSTGVRRRQSASVMLPG